MVNGLGDVRSASQLLGWRALVAEERLNALDCRAFLPA